MSMSERRDRKRSEQARIGVLRSAGTKLGDIRFSTDNPQATQVHLMTIAGLIRPNVGERILIPTKGLPDQVADLFEGSDTLAVSIQPNHKYVLLSEPDEAISKIAVYFDTREDHDRWIDRDYAVGDDTETAVQGHTYYKSRQEALRDLKVASRDPHFVFTTGVGILGAIVDTELNPK